MPNSVVVYIVELRADVAKHFQPGPGMRTTRLIGIRAARVPD